MLLVAFCVRMYVATTAPYLPDEIEIAIPMAESISFTGPDLNLPIRGPHHPALPYYFVKASTTLLGASPLGYRFLHILSGLAMIAVIFRMTDRWAGRTAATWAALLLAFNEYHIGVSAFATAKAPHLLFMTLSMYGFTRFLTSEQPKDLYWTSAFAALAFYCKEHSALLIPIFLLTLAQARYRRWFQSRSLMLGALLYFAILMPDIVWNFAYAHTVESTYRDHLSRVGGLGFTTHYFMFFARGTLQWLNVQVTGLAAPDTVSENPSMNSLFGLVLLAAVTAFTFHARPRESVPRFLVLLFWGILGFFVFIRPGEPLKPMDNMAWYWVDATLFPAVILSGYVLSSLKGTMALVTRSLVIVGMLYATWSVASSAFDFNPTTGTPTNRTTVSSR